jgi:hypothetical protein
MRSFTLLLGVVLLVVGIVGFVTGSHDHELIVFGINMAHNVVHILSGALGILAATSGAHSARVFCLAFGSVYGLVALAGFAGLEPLVRLLNLNTADNLLHLGIAVTCLVVAFASRRHIDVAATR